MTSRALPHGAGTQPHCIQYVTHHAPCWLSVYVNTACTCWFACTVHSVVIGHGVVQPRTRLALSISPVHESAVRLMSIE